MNLNQDEVIAFAQAYARGFHDGRETGIERPELYGQNSLLRYAYRRGYDHGVAEYSAEVEA